MLTTEGVNYYCNLASPYVFEAGSIKYIDYDLDIKVKKNLNFKVVDINEFNRHRQKMEYPEIIEKKIMDHLEILKS